jgi:hypothetical protein
MSVSEERLRILRLLQEGKISPEEGNQLLEALDAAADKAGKSSAVAAPKETEWKGGRWLRILITDTDTGKTRVNVRLPVSLVTAGVKMGARFAPEVEGLDIEQLMSYIRSGETGQILDVYDDADGEHIQVFIE